MNITKEAIQELQKTIGPVVEKLGHNGEFMYEVYRRQVYVDAFTSDGGYLLFWIFCLAMVISSKKIWIKLSDDSDQLVMVVYWVLISLGIYQTLCSLTNMAAKLINPDYYAIQEILSIMLAK